MSKYCPACIECTDCGTLLCAISMRKCEHTTGECNIWNDSKLKYRKQNSG